MPPLASFFIFLAQQSSVSSVPHFPLFLFISPDKARYYPCRRLSELSFLPPGEARYYPCRHLPALSFLPPDKARYHPCRCLPALSFSAQRSSVILSMPSPDDALIHAAIRRGYHSCRHLPSLALDHIIIALTASPMQQRPPIVILGFDFSLFQKQQFGHIGLIVILRLSLLGVLRSSPHGRLLSCFACEICCRTSAYMLVGFLVFSRAN